MSIKFNPKEKTKRPVFCRKCGVRKIVGENHSKNCKNKN